MATTQLGVGSDNTANSTIGGQRTFSVPLSFLVFAVERLYALDIELVERVLRAVEIRPLPSGPEILAGLVNVRGSVLPVVDLRARFGLPKRTARLDDCLTESWGSFAKTFSSGSTISVIDCPASHI